MEAINQESVVAPGDLREAPISLTTTDTNLTGNWKFFRPAFQPRLPPCQGACPLHNDIAAVMRAVAAEDMDGALAALRRSNPLPAVTGRVCPNFCRETCRRGPHDQDVLIGCVERFVGDYGLDKPFPRPRTRRSEKVAVVGSGPAGLAAACFLAQAGIGVTIYERDPEPGGLLRYGIPAYRLPKDVVHREIHNLVHSLDIDLRLQHPVSAQDLPELLQTAKFVFCAPGLWSPVRPRNLPDSPHIWSGLDILHHINSGGRVQGDSFAVIGGGNAAVDVARSLIRMGKEVDILYRRTYAEMPAYADEKAQALEEGVRLHEQQLVDRVDPQSDGLLLTCTQAVNRDGRIESGPQTGTMSVDRLVLATGQTPHMDLPAGERILTGGDLALGPATVVQALASGHQGAATILDRIAPGLERDMGTQAPNLPLMPENTTRLDCVPREAPLEEPVLEGPVRRQGFAEVHPGVSGQEAVQMASRCLQCGQCNGCGICWFFCPDVAVSLTGNPEHPEVHIDQEHCKGCGLCAALCPRGMIEMEEDV